MAQPTANLVPEAARPDLARILDTIDAEQVVVVLVFGSTARHDDNEQSDLDLLVVVKNGEAQRALLDEIHKGGRLSFSPLVFTKDELIHEAEVRPSFVAHLLDEALGVRISPHWRAIRKELHRRVGDVEALEREVRGRARRSRPSRAPSASATAQPLPCRTSTRLLVQS